MEEQALVVGARFTSFKELESVIANYEEKNFTRLWKRDSRTIAASRISRTINESLIYYEIRYTCRHGGKKFESTGKGVRETSTYRLDCPMFVQLRASSDGNTLEVKAMECEHNHETSKILYSHYASERRLPPDIRNEAQNMLAMKANKKILQQKLQAKTGKIITLRDLTNLQSQLNNNKADSLENCINILRTEYFADVSVLQDDKQNFQGLFAQTEAMKKVMAAYPEFLAIDATYKLLKISVPLYLIITEDGACQTEIVAMCLLTNEDQKSLSWFLSTFKEHNPECSKTKCIITDKDMSERHVIKQIFPDASLIICIFHSLKTFRREVTCEKLGITQSQRIQCLELFQKLLYAKTDREFQEIQTSLYDVAPKAVKDYYNKNWRNIRNEWNVNENFVKYNFLNNTNNRLECLNSKLKSVISKNSSLEDFIHGFFTIVGTLQQERDHKAIYALQKRICLKYSSDSDEYKYFKYLTREAAKHVIKEIELSTMQVHEDDNPNDDRNFTVRQGKDILHVTENRCSCAFFISMILPCRHIFAVRRQINQPIFDKDLVEKRWTLEYFKAHHRVFSEQNFNNIENDDVLVTTQPSSKTLSYAQKRKKALGRTDILADLCAQRSNMLYEQRSQILENLISYWKAGKQVCIQLVDDFTASFLANDPSDPDNGREHILDIECNTVAVNDDALEGAVCIAYQAVNDKNNNNASDNYTEIHPPGIVTSVVEREAESISDKVNNNLPRADDKFEISGTGCNTSSTTITTTTVSSSSVAISTIKMPGKVKQRGRPKGQNITVVGLSKRKNKPLPYCKTPVPEKQKFLMKHFVTDTAKITAAIQDGHLIEENLVEIRPEKISHAILDEEVDIHIIRQFFTHDAWKAVQQVVRILKKKKIWICSGCQHDLGDDQSIMCDGCLLWQHLKCVNLKTRPKAKLWFCKSCFSG